MNSAVEIMNLLSTYALHMDRGRLDEAAALFKDATIVLREGIEVDGAGLRDLWRKSVRIHPDGTPRTKHVITNPIMQIDDEAGTATVRTYYTVLQAAEGLPLQVIAGGRYRDEFTRTDGTWHFSKRYYYMLDKVGDMSAHLLLGSPEEYDGDD